ncbi:hypothetical protein, partial [Mycoplasmopsis bovis]|uniref:hypothetical protein n=1 Tax=Mycoplasmopsis bovis TaxID=28903 RepID=UPI003D2C8853
IKVKFIEWIVICKNFIYAFDLNSCVCEKISKKYNDDIENFAQQMNIDSVKLRKIINSNDPINVNGND